MIPEVSEVYRAAMRRRRASMPMPAGTVTCLPLTITSRWTANRTTYPGVASSESPAACTPAGTRADTGAGHGGAPRASSGAGPREPRIASTSSAVATAEYATRAPNPAGLR